MATNEEIEVEEEVQNEPLSPEGARKLRVAKVLPLHAATGSAGRTRRGAPAAVIGPEGKRKAKPVVDDLEYHARMQELQLRFIEEDELVQAAQNKAPPTEIYRLTLIKAARDAASLEFQRIEHEKLGHDTSQLISRHAKILRDLAVLEAELKETGASVLDPHSPELQKVFRLWGEFMKEVVDETLSPEQRDVFWTKWTTAIEKWEERVEEILR